VKPKSDKIELRNIVKFVGLDDLKDKTLEVRHPLDNFIPLFVDEAFYAGGEVYGYIDKNDILLGIFVYDPSESVGTSFSDNIEISKLFLNLKEHLGFYSYQKMETYNEIEDYYILKLESLTLTHRYKHNIKIAKNEDLDTIVSFMKHSLQIVSERWIRSAYECGEVCFIYRINNGIVGIAWLALSGNIGRLHSIYVTPEFRRTGIGKDLLFARLFYLKNLGINMAFSEIARGNKSSIRNSQSLGMKKGGSIYYCVK
jgi:GNAT superfamily N-acetyltransferase